MTDLEWLAHMLATSRKAFPTGSRWRVKATAGKRGIVRNGRLQDYLLYPKEIGTVVESTYVATDGSTQTTRRLKFERDRRLSVERPDSDDLDHLAKISKTKTPAQT